MTAEAHLDLRAVDVGMVHLGGPSAIYDMPVHDQAEALAWAMVVSEAPELSGAPASHAALVSVWNQAHGKARKQSATRDAAMAWMEGE